MSSAPTGYGSPVASPLASRRGLIDLGRRFVRRWIDEDVTDLAAGVAFYAVLGLFPTLLAVAAALGFLDGVLGADLATQVQETVLGWMNSILTDRAADTRRAVERLFREGSGDLFTFAVLAALWSGSRGTNGLMRALSRVYAVGDARPYWQRRLVAVALLVLTVVAAAIVLSMFVLGPLLGGGRRIADAVGLGDTFVVVWSLLRIPLAFVALTAWAAVVFHAAPDGRQGWTADLPGAVLTGVLWVLLSAGLRVYLAVAGAGNQVFGVLGGALIVLVWMYLLALALLTGGVLNIVLLERRGGSAAEGEPASAD